VSVEYVDLADFIATISKVTDLGLADSALHAPSAQFGDREFYEDFVDKAAVLIVLRSYLVVPVSQ
jgi:prophage maintenance system killer protein